MTEWFFILVPLLVLSDRAALPVCRLRKFRRSRDQRRKAAPIPGLHLWPNQQPRSSEEQQGRAKKADVIAYWRLVDAASSTTAKDEKGFQTASTKLCRRFPMKRLTRPTLVLNPQPAAFLPGKRPHHHANPAAMCRIFNGGHVLVPFKPGPVHRRVHNRSLD